MGVTLLCIVEATAVQMPKHPPPVPRTPLVLVLAQLVRRFPFPCGLVLSALALALAVALAGHV